MKTWNGVSLGYDFVSVRLLALQDLNKRKTSHESEKIAHQFVNIFLDSGWLKITAKKSWTCQKNSSRPLFNIFFYSSPPHTCTANLIS